MPMTPMSEVDLGLAVLGRDEEVVVKRAVRDEPRAGAEAIKDFLGAAVGVKTAAA